MNFFCISNELSWQIEALEQRAITNPSPVEFCCVKPKMRSLAQSAAYRFGPFEVDGHAGELRAEGKRVPLQQQPFQVLLILLRAPGELITREELRQAIWPEDTFVEFDSGLNTAVKKIRCALGDCANAPSYVETVPKRGYRFIATVKDISEDVPKTRQPLRRWIWPAAIVLAFLAGYVFHAVFVAR